MSAVTPYHAAGLVIILAGPTCMAAGVATMLAELTSIMAEAKMMAAELTTTLAMPASTVAGRFTWADGLDKMLAGRYRSIFVE